MSDNQLQTTGPVSLDAFTAMLNNFGLDSMAPAVMPPEDEGLNVNFMRLVQSNSQRDPSVQPGEFEIRISETETVHSPVISAFVIGIVGSVSTRSGNWAPRVVFEYDEQGRRKSSNVVCKSRSGLNPVATFTRDQNGNPNTLIDYRQFEVGPDGKPRKMRVMITETTSCVPGDKNACKLCTWTEDKQGPICQPAPIVLLYVPEWDALVQWQATSFGAKKAIFGLKDYKYRSLESWIRPTIVQGQKQLPFTRLADDGTALVYPIIISSFAEPSQQNQQGNFVPRFEVIYGDVVTPMENKLTTANLRQLASSVFPVGVTPADDDVNRIAMIMFQKSQPYTLNADGTSSRLSFNLQTQGIDRIEDNGLIRFFQEKADFANNHGEDKVRGIGDYAPVQGGESFAPPASAADIPPMINVPTVPVGVPTKPDPILNQLDLNFAPGEREEVPPVVESPTAPVGIDFPIPGVQQEVIFTPPTDPLLADDSQTAATPQMPSAPKTTALPWQ